MNRHKRKNSRLLNEQDKRARTELDIQILKDDLYDPVLETSNKKHNLSRNTSTIGNLVSFLPSKFFGGNITESGRTDVWCYYPNDMFTSGVTIDGIKGVCCS
ncbi:6306_t:CDS:2 [Gigaspora margarita]|uniref:6306_t:CDS:1 n=1 Tax=Gigaspora margarita TaxID=4874 RepID=A0ABN7V059_GIGMA|nr:6306_t:CDS:2 [Gigaspora margarita]